MENFSQTLRTMIREIDEIKQTQRTILGMIN
jgi:hypothetical protein